MDKTVLRLLRSNVDCFEKTTSSVSASLAKRGLFFLLFLYLVLALVHPSCAVLPHRPSSIDFSCDLTPQLSSGLKPVPPRRGDNGFSLKLEGLPESYEPEKTYTVTLRSTHPVTFRGFALAAVHKSNFSSPAGGFKILNPWATKAISSCKHVMTHSTTGKKASVQFVWTSPSSGFGCVQIRASVVQKGTIWYRDDGDLSLSICEATGAPSSSKLSRCCSCGSAQYRMTFYGLWSPQTHPKDYPTYSTHWSNVIGASHSDRYSIWDYGEYASDGVKKVAEWGWPNAAEDEIRAQGDDVLSVIKTRAQWPAYQPRNLREPPSSVFDVDSGRHLVSLLSMLGPSPDWNVGITKESLCTTQCGWEAEKIFDLTPWDAGTDSGVSYISPNSPTNPPDKIRALTTSDDPESPFFNPAGGPISPLARVVLQRISTSGEQCGPSPVSTSTSRSSVKTILIEPAITSCVYHDWSEWSTCEVTCGWGIKVRSKSLKGKLVPSASCEPSIMEKEICKGSAKCDNEDSSTVCLYSEWGLWSECTASCGSDALRFRTRELQWPSEPSNCHEPLKDMKFDCNSDPCEKGEATCSYADWSDWMPCSAQCGVGQTLRKRIILDGFGCESNMMETSKCMASVDCKPPVGFDISAGCTYSPWTGWMPCPVTCGVGETFRKRVLDSSAPNVRCEEIQMERTKCMTSESCPQFEALDDYDQDSCEYASWSDWMPCSASCGVGSTLRKRFLSGVSDSNCEEVQMETVKCYMPPCHVMSGRVSETPGLLSTINKNCIYGSWTAWMPCSVTCGKGETLRKRFLKKSLDISHTCEGFEMETNRCTVTATCDVDPEEQTEGASKIEERWSEWSECSATCGYGERSRTKIIDDCDPSAENECVTTQLEECVVRIRCPVDCELGEWTSWSACAPCKSTISLGQARASGRKSFQTRTRKRLVKPKLGGIRCAPRKERRKCAC